MNEYIEREKVISELENCLVNIDRLCDDPYYSTGINEGLTEAISMITDMPAADVRPERHGEWKEVSYDRQVIYCSSCGERSPCNWEWDFCPRCGAKMDGKGGKNNGV